jgi:hypothetical protein
MDLISSAVYDGVWSAQLYGGIHCYESAKLRQTVGILPSPSKYLE